MSKYISTMNQLTRRFVEKHDSQNKLHKDLQARLNDLAGQLQSVEVLRQTSDALTVGRGMNRLNTLTDAAESWLSKNKVDTEKSFEAAMREKAGLTPGPYGQEIRSRLHAMNPGDRVKAVHDLIQAHDGQTLAAILDAPSMLTGLTQEDLGKYREQFYQIAVPDLVKARDTFRDLSEHVQAAVDTCRKISLEHNDPAKLRELEEREAAIKAAQGE